MIWTNRRFTRHWKVACDGIITCYPGAKDPQTSTLNSTLIVDDVAFRSQNHPLPLMPALPAYAKLLPTHRLRHSKSHIFPTRVPYAEYLSGTDISRSP